MSWFAINHCVLFGNMTRAPELRSLPSGVSVCEFGIAVSESVKNGQTGEWTERPNFFDITVWNKLGEYVAREGGKGMPTFVEGRLRFEQWDAPDGTKRSKVKVVAEKVILTARREKSDGSAPRQGQTPPTAQGGPWDSNAVDPDSDIPF